MARIAIALLVAVLYIWVIMVTMPYRRNVIQQQDLTDYYATQEREFAYAKQAYETEKAKPNPNEEQLQLAQERLALYCWEKRDYDRAVELLDDLAKKRKPAEGAPYSEKYVDTLLRLAGVYRDVTNWKVAEMTYQEVMDYDKKFFENTDPNNVKLARDLNNMGLFYYLKGTSEKEEAARNAILKQSSEFLNQAIKKYQAKLGPDSQSEGIALWNLYLTERDLGNVKEADAIKARAEAIDAKANRPVKAP
ncbi:hypothetical protein KF913_24395 [Candidatus Obscuribacterales bacterium]|nr:hypothetical protein [Candidatus Obscuribacterales bacterium]